MERICIDAIGPIDDGSPVNDNKYILVIIDASFKAYHAIPNTRHYCISFKPTERLGGHFWMSFEIVSGNGTLFVNELIRSLLSNSGIQHILIQASYSKEENSLIQKANMEVNRHITSMPYDNLVRSCCLAR